MRFLNASVLERKSLNRNLSWGFPLGNLLPKTRVLKHCVLERKRRPNANASVLGTQRFRTLSSSYKCKEKPLEKIVPEFVDTGPTFVQKSMAKSSPEIFIKLLSRELLLDLLDVLARHNPEPRSEV